MEANAVPAAAAIPPPPTSQRLHADELEIHQVQEGSQSRDEFPSRSMVSSRVPPGGQMPAGEEMHLMWATISQVQAALKDLADKLPSLPGNGITLRDQPTASGG